MKYGLSRGPFQNMQFPDYAFAEYPKMITTASGKRVRVENRAEEIRTIADQGQRHDVKTDPLVAERDAALRALGGKNAQIEALLKENAELKAKAIVDETTGAPNDLTKGNAPAAPAPDTSAEVLAGSAADAPAPAVNSLGSLGRKTAAE